MGEAPDLREQEDCPSPEACDRACDQHGTAETDAPVEWFEGGDGHGYVYQYLGPIHYLCECGEHFLNRERWLAHKAEAAFWLAQEAGDLPRDRGGYAHAGFIAGFTAARVLPPGEGK